MEVTIEMVRLAVRALGDGGKKVSYQQVYEALGLEGEAQQGIVRARISSMRKHGEVEFLERGIFTYNEAHRPRNSKMLATVWRFVRASKPGWTIADATMLTRVSYTHTLRYVNWLEGEGYVRKQGKDAKQANTYAATSKAQASPETPYPPARKINKDPFQKERAAAATIVRLMLCADPYAKKTAREITLACQVLLDRFGKTIPSGDDNIEVEGETC